MENRFDMGVSHRLVAAVLALGWALAVRAELSGRVVAVHDGDTLTLATARSQSPAQTPTRTRIRLFGIDAPERGQAYGNAARRALASLVAGRDVRVAERGRDGYGRVLGSVFVDGTAVNERLVQDGYAWVFRRFENDAALLALEAEAKAARRGLWRDPHPIPPWRWRDRERVPASVAPAVRSEGRAWHFSAVMLETRSMSPP